MLLAPRTGYYSTILPGGIGMQKEGLVPWRTHIEMDYLKSCGRNLPTPLSFRFSKQPKEESDIRS